MQFQYDLDGPFIEKHAEAVLAYRVDWVEWLRVEELPQLDASQWSADEGLSIVATAVMGSVAACVISGGELGMVYWVTNMITAGALTQPQPFRIKIVR